MSIIARFTLKTLKKNKSRSLVTIIGIVLSVAMVTAVISCITSLQNYLVRQVEVNVGSWYGAAYSINSDERAKLLNDDRITDRVTLYNLGYATVQSNITDKPYIFVSAVCDDLNKLLPTYITDGRMPRSDNEIILPNHLLQNSNTDYKIGDKLTLNLGDRLLEGNSLYQKTPFDSSESLSDFEKRQYTVVGFYNRPKFEDYQAPGFTALTKMTNPKDNYRGMDLYFKTAKMGDVYSITESNSSINFNINSDLLRFSGQSNEVGFMNVLYGMGGILLFIIMFGSISLIYNAFSISVGSRVRQFGILKSIGATNRQIKTSVIFEAFFLCLFGVPLGVLSGVLGMFVTFKCTSGLIDMFVVNSDKSVSFSLSVSPMALVAAAVIGVVTVLISAWIPAHRAVKMTAIDAIKRNEKIKASKPIKTSRLTAKLFGFEGMLASKYYKRSRKKYRATVVSLFMSIVLFISATSFTAYMKQSVGMAATDYGYDISCGLSPTKSLNYDIIEKAFESLPEVSKVGYSDRLTKEIEFNGAAVNRDYLKFMGNDENADDGVRLYSYIYFVSDRDYKAYLKENNLKEAEYLNKNNPKALAMVSVNLYSNDDNRFHSFEILKNVRQTASICMVKETMGDYKLAFVSDDNSTVTYRKGKLEKTVKYRDALEKIPLNIEKTVKKLPYCTANSEIGSVVILLPQSLKNTVLGKEQDNNERTFYFKSSNPSSTTDAIYDYLKGQHIAYESVFNVHEMQKTSMAMIRIVNIFSYGFIVLISLIAIANVFNTITTNIYQRRREFAMLKSVGMTNGGFNKMMNFECLLYGFKSLILGIPVSILLSYLMYLAIGNGFSSLYIFPWFGVLLSVLAVFTVVFVTMLYSMSSIKKDNPIDALKNENL